MINGLMLIDKQSGGTSHDVVDDVRRLLGQNEVGHSGTLDPLASGLMVVLLGQATKLSDYILSDNKKYRVEIRFGMTTDSGDTMGKTLTEVGAQLSLNEIEAAAQNLAGAREYVVPIYSATKVKGKRLYEYARAEKPVILPRKFMNFYDIQMINGGEDHATFEVSCDKGGYIRSWVEELGRSLGPGAVMTGLRRLRSGAYSIESAMTIQEFSENLKLKPIQQFDRGFISFESALPHWPRCSIKGREELLLRNGQVSYDLANRLIVVQKQALNEQRTIGIKVLGETGRMIGILEARPLQGIKIRRIFAH